MRKCNLALKEVYRLSCRREWFFHMNEHTNVNFHIISVSLTNFSHVQSQVIIRFMQKEISGWKGGGKKLELNFRQDLAMNYVCKKYQLNDCGIIILFDFFFRVCFHFFMSSQFIVNEVGKWKGILSIIFIIFYVHLAGLICSCSRKGR